MLNDFIRKFVDNLVSGPKVWLGRSIFFFILLLPIILLGVINYKHTYREETKDVFDQKKALSYLAATTVHERLDALVNLGISLATRKGLIEGAQKGDWSEAVSRLETVIGQFPIVDRMLLYDTGAKIKEVMPSMPGSIGQSRAKREWYAQVKKRWMPYVSAVHKRGT